MSAQPSGAVGYPPGGALRRWTRLVPRTRGRGRVLDLFSELYTVLVTLVVAASMVAPLARSQAVFRTAPTTAAEVDTGWLTLLLAVAVLGAGTGLLARTGPVALGAAAATWWLPLPGERRSLLRPSLGLPVGAAAAAGAMTGLLLLMALDPQLTVLLGAAAALTGAAVGASVALALVPVEAAGRRRVAGVVGDLLLALVPVGALLLVLLPPGPLTVAAAWWPLGVAGALLVAAGWGADRALPRIHDSELRERGAVATELRGAALGMDTRALGRALDDGPGRVSRRSARLTVVPRLVGALGPGVVLAAADALLLHRSPRRFLQLVSGAALALVSVLLPELPAVVAALGLVSGAWLAALGTTPGARYADVVPAVDALLPLGERAVRAWRVVVPGLVMTLWALPVFVVVGYLQGDAGWLALGVLAAPAWAAGAVRSAYRPPPDFSGPLIVTPMGAFPPGMGTVASKGPDVVLLAAVPLAAAMLIGGPTPVLLVVQLAVSAIAVTLAVRPVRTKEER